MLSVFVPAESSLKKVMADDLAAPPEGAVWIDLVNPTAAEDRAVERLCGIAVPTREDMQEIEISSRLYIENGARYMTATLMCQSDTDMPRTTAVTFILAGHRLVTVRYDTPKPFALVENKLARACPAGVTGEMVLMELLDAVIDRCADILERIGVDVDTVIVDERVHDPSYRRTSSHAEVCAMCRAEVEDLRRFDAGGRVNIPAVPAPQAHFKTAEAAVKLSLEQEERVTEQINALVSLAKAESDYTSDNFLQWFVKEQLEEVASMDQLLRVVQRAGEGNLLRVEEYLAREKGHGVALPQEE